MAQKYPKIAQNGPKMTQNCPNGDISPVSPTFCISAGKHPMGQVSSIITIAKYHPSYKKKHSRKRLSVFLLYFFLAIPTCWSKTRAIVRGTQRRGQNILCHFSNVQQFQFHVWILEYSEAGTFNLAVGWELKLVVSANLYIVRKLQVNDRSVCLIFWYLSNSIKQQILGRQCYLHLWRYTIYNQK